MSAEVKLSEEQLETLGQLVDKAENYLAWKDNPHAPIQMKKEAYETGLSQIRDELKKFYFENGGEDVWS
jgi:hypothetical protein